MLRAQIAMLALIGAFVIGAQASWAQSTDDPERGRPGAPAAATHEPEQRGWFGRMWDRMRGRGNPHTEEGQEFHRERREEHEAGKAERERERMERREADDDDEGMQKPDKPAKPEKPEKPGKPGKPGKGRGQR